MKRLIILLAILTLMTPIFAHTVQIGWGTRTSSSLPIYGYYGYSYSQQIYTQSQINTSGDIISIRFYYVSGAIANSKDWVIYMGHTDKTTFSSLTDWVAYDELTEVYNGDVSSFLPAANNWMELTLDTPFSYNNTDNLLIAVHQNTPGSAPMSWGSFTSGTSTGMCYYSHTVNPDPASPPSAMGRENFIDRIQLVFPDISAPLAPVLLSPANGNEACINAILRWQPSFGGGDPLSYDLYLGTNPNPPLVASNLTETSYSPQLQGNTTYYWKVVAQNDIGASPASPIWSFNTAAPELIQIGDGTSSVTYPFCVSHGFERSATIYNQSQIGSYGLISQVAWSVETPRTTVVPYKIWLKTIDSDALTPQPWDELMDGAILVKEGNHAFDSVGWHNFVFDIPFAYTTGNLLIGVQSDCGGNGSSHSAYLYYTPNANLVHQTWSTDGSPSSGNGFLATNLPNIIMHIAPPTDEPAFVVSPDSHDFGEVKIGNDKNSSFTISNVDGGELVINSISISGNPAFTLSNLPTLPVTLGTVETTVFTVNFAPTVLGSASATITIVDNLGNRSEHTVAVSGTGSHYQTIGHAASNLNLPVYPYMDYSYSQSIYLQSEIATQDQRIERLAYYWNGAGTGNWTNGWTIYMGHTSQTAFDSGTGWIPFNQLSQVYSGRPDIPATAGWIEVILDIPFVYNNTDNLVIAVHENIPNYNGYDQFFHCTCTTTNRSLRYFSISTIPDPASPPEGTMARGIPNAKLYLQDIPTTPVLTTQPDALNFGVCTQNLASMPETIILMNYGIGTLNLTADDVNVVGTDAAMFSLITTSLPAALSVGQEVAVGVIFTPTSAGAKSATLRIVYNGQDYDVPLSGYGLPTDPVTVGTGSEVSAYPFYSSYQDARTQMLFTVDELMAAGALPSHFIDHIAFNVSYANTSTLNNLMIRLKTTTATGLSGFDTDNDSFSISYLANYAILNLGWIYFEFAEPFFWNGTENLLVDVSFDNNSTTSNSTVNATPAPGMTWAARQQNATGSTLTGGYHQANRPNIRFLFGETASTDPELLISPDVYNFGVVDIGESKSKSIRMLNIGGAPLNIASIEISGSVAFSLSNLPTLPLELEYTQTATFNVVYTPTMTGTDTATLTITDDQQNRHTFSLASPGWSVSGRNNRTAHTINISGNSVYGITIGDGGQIASMPIDFHYRTSLYQNIYNADELGYFIGMINGIRFYNQFNNNLSAKPVKIWLASTTQTDLSAGWIPASQMELVFDGTMDFPNGQNVIEFTFAEPYLHLDGGNLVMMVQRPMDTVYHTSTDFFKAQTGNANRARNMANNATEYDPYNPTGGSTTGVFPQTTFVVIPTLIGTITGTVLGDGNAPLAGVSVDVDGYSYSATTDANGAFTISHLLPGDYTVIFSKATYITQTVNIVLDANETAVINITLAEVPYAPNSVVAEQNEVYSAVNLSWNAPDPDAEEISESFESADKGKNLRNVAKNTSIAQINTGNSRSLLGYQIWRLTAGQESEEATWISLTDEAISTPSYEDESWGSLPDGTFKWAVKAVYTANVLSAPALSNALVKEQVGGTVLGFVHSSNGQSIPGAVVTASNGVNATTNSSGAYSMLLPIGTYHFTATANGYQPLSQDDIIVMPNQDTTLDFVMNPLANEDEVVPITATALKGNYPNPFNPETTISYDLKDAAPVRLEIYNLKGQLVRSLVNEMQPTGCYRIVFDGKDDKKLPLSSGVYLYRFSAGDYRKTRKMMLMQ